MASSEFVGGVAPEQWQQAPPLKVVAARLREVTKGCLLVGHGLSKDLVALGIPHPKCAHCGSTTAAVHVAAVPTSHFLGLGFREDCCPKFQEGW